MYDICERKCVWFDCKRMSAFGHSLFHYKKSQLQQKNARSQRKREQKGFLWYNSRQSKEGC